MSFLKSVTEPWARIVAGLMTIGFAAIFYGPIGWEFAAGMVCGGVAFGLFHSALRIDERAAWRHGGGSPTKKPSQDDGNLVT